MQESTKEMQTKGLMSRGTNHRLLCVSVRGWLALSLAVVVLTGAMLLSGCGGNSSTQTQQSGAIAGNWQFSLTNPDTSGNYPATAQYGLQGGFLLQSNGSVSGQAVYSISGPMSGGPPPPTPPPYGVCDSGSVPLTGTVSGQTVNLTAVTPTQTFTLQGTLASNGQITSATGFTTTGGTAAGFSSCGMPTPNGGSSWSAISVPALTGSISGSLHSKAGTGNALIEAGQDFAVTGSLSQGENIGASNATVTGTLSFLDPTTGLSDYPCIPAGTVSVNGQISGNTVILQLIDTNGANDGQIGISGSEVPNSQQLNQVTLNSTSNGYALQSSGLGYIINSKTCPTNGNVNDEDLGYICLGLNGTTACQEPVTLSPATIIFPAQGLGSTPTTQTITLTSNTASNLQLAFTVNSGANSPFGGGYSDFSGVANYPQAVDSCVTGGETLQPDTTGQSFSLPPAQSCTVTVSFSPQESCPWFPFETDGSVDVLGAPPEWCPIPQTALITATVSSNTADGDKTFTVPITGTGLSSIVPSTHELDFGAEEPLNPPESSVPQLLSFTNNSTAPVQILGSVPCTNAVFNGHPVQHILPHSGSGSGPVAGLQVVASQPEQIVADGNTIQYLCDSDIQTSLPNFQISADTCTGTNLVPQASCSLQITYVPQPQSDTIGGLDYFLELNTLQCYGGVTSDCEIDSGRFPVELRANSGSPLRMTPSAGLDFGVQTAGKSSAPLQVTITNDPNLQTTQTVTFVGRISAPSNYSETDDCPTTLSPGGSCTLTIVFKPSTTGFIPGILNINYTTSTQQNLKPQTVYLRGMGQ